ncbi:hypothetical protein C0995_010805 [Termitomyces sp. Mi166|nr:hypothetical protein C0995_010805 [Termitomyces sp. Mi166\
MIAIAAQLKAEALKWTENVKDKKEKAAGVLKSTTERRATELLGATDQVRGLDPVKGTDLMEETNSVEGMDPVFRPDHPALQLIRKVIVCIPPPEDGEEETSQYRGAITLQMLLGKCPVNTKAAREAGKEKRKAKAIKATVKSMRKQKSMRFIDLDDNPVLSPMVVDKIAEGVMNELSTCLADIKNGMSSLENELMDTLIQAEEEQIKQIKQMFCSYKVNIENLHRHVDNFNATVLAVSDGLQKTQMQVQQQAQHLQNAFAG